jgi:hypothetical protein
VCRSFVGIHKKQRAGAFRGVFTHFLLCDRRDRIFDHGSIDTTVCSRTLHEL